MIRSPLTVMCWHCHQVVAVGACECGRVSGVEGVFMDGLRYSTWVEADDPATPGVRYLASPEGVSRSVVHMTTIRLTP